MMRRAIFRVGAVCALIAVLTIAAGMASAGEAQAREGLVAYRILHAPRGGVVRARDGAELLVPSGILKNDALATITLLPGGRYDFNIAGAWSGRVRVTLPRRHHASMVMHQIGGIWVQEGARGHRTVWVDQLSIFSWLGDKLKAAACLTRNPLKFVQCLIAKGLSKIDSTLVKWIAGLAGLDDQCVQSLLASKGFVASLYTAIVSSACTGHAGEVFQPTPTTSPPPPTPTSPPAPTSPPSTTPAPPPPAPPPPPPPPPPPSQSIQIGWSSAHPGWIWMTVNGFAPGSYPYTCNFGSGGDETFTLTETSTPETWDNAHTCYDFIHGDTVWVTIGSVGSNTLTVP
jgi:hypothetical protein